jgi:hypothetical protein
MRIGLLGTSLEESDQRLLHTLCSVVGPGVEVYETFGDGVTHVVVQAKKGKGTGKGEGSTWYATKRSVKLLRGMLGGKWIIAVQWVTGTHG